jgi:hypothetical protein
VDLVFLAVFGWAIHQRNQHPELLLVVEVLQ